MMGLDNPIHIAFLLIVVLLVFGAKRLPEMGHSLGTGLRGFKEAIGGEGGVSSSLSVVDKEQPTPEPVAAASVTTAPVAGAPLVSVQSKHSA